MGEGNNARTLFARNPMDSRKPLIWAGNPGAPTPEKLFLPIVKSLMKEDVVDLITCGSIVDIDGYDVRTAEVSELLATRRELEYLHQAAKETGREGIGMLAAESSVSEIGDLAVANPKMLRSCDSHLVAMFNELIIDKGNMLRAANSIGYGMKNASLATAMVGGFGGGAPGTAVLQAASFMAANIVCLADYHLCHPIHLTKVATSTRECMWVQSIICQAFARNAPCIIVCDIYPKSSPMTSELLYEVAANAIAATVSGGHLEGVGVSDGKYPNGTGLEVRLMGKIGHAVAEQGIDLKKANKLIQELLSKYEHVFKNKEETAFSFEESYDLETLEPKKEWLDIYTKVKEELNSMGIKFD
jgi:methylamine---corrinoid protein Co-methyltransferase